MFRKTTLLLFLVFSLQLSSSGQEQEKPMPDRWRGLIIDKSTAEDAVKVLGQPISDKNKSFKPYPFDKRIGTKGKTFRHLEFKEIKGLDSATLVFTDNKLICIYLDLREKIQASSVQNNYGIEFEPKISGFTSSSNPNNYERIQGKLYPKNYPSAYHIVGTTQEVWIGAAIDNSSFASLMLGSSRGSTGAGAYPGKAVSILILSRALENREGEDVLK